MVYLLTILLCVMLVSVLYINKWDIISPWVISVAMFFLSVTVAALNAKKWGLDISLVCMAVILGALLAFGIGEKTASRAFEKYPDKKSSASYGLDIDISMKVTCLLSILMFVGFLIVFKRAYEVSLEGGNTGGIRTMLSYVRSVMLTPGNHMGRLCNHITILSQAIAYIYLWVVINKVIIGKVKIKHIVYIIPVILYLGMAATGAGRNFLIQILAYGLIIFVFLSHGAKPWTFKDVIKVVAVAGIVIGVYLILFLMLGKMKGNHQEKIYETFSVYIGSSIMNLNEYLSRPINESVYIGEETLYGFYSIFRKFGFNLPDKVYHLENSVITNVYTALRRYINDYGYAGMLIIQVYIGAFYSIFYNVIKRKKNGLALIIYGWLMQPLATQAIEEVLMLRYFNTTSIYFMGYLLIGYYILIVKNESWKSICRQNQ